METFPLLALTTFAIGAVGAAVRNLHLLLIRLNIGEVPEDEASTEAYGRDTIELVASLRMQLNLQPPRRGEVDEASARAINEHAFELGVFQLVAGTVVDAQGELAAGLTVRVHDVDNPGLACAEVKTDEAGGYVAYYDPAFYVRASFGPRMRSTWWLALWEGRERSWHAPRRSPPTGPTRSTSSSAPSQSRCRLRWA